MNLCMIVHLTTSLQHHHTYWTEENLPTNIIQVSVVFPATDSKANEQNIQPCLLVCTMLE